jgi:hypothetical protein
VLSEKFFTCSKCGKRPPEVLSFTVGDRVLCSVCAPQKGRKLDALVAEKVLGHKAVHNDALKAYSLDQEAAWEVVRHMRADGFSFKVWQFSEGQFDLSPDHAVVSFVCNRGPCEKHGTDFHNCHGAHDVEGSTLPIAICKAALMAIAKSGVYG